MMKSEYPLRSLGGVLELDRDEVAVEPTASYRLAGMYSFGRGIFERGAVEGADMSYRTLFRLHEHQLVMSRLNGWEGAVAVVGDDIAGAFVSNEYPTFLAKDGAADPSYLAHLCRWPEFWDALRARARGMGSDVGARRLRVHPDQLLQVEVPLPDMTEQRRVASRLRRLEDNLTAVASLEARATTVAEAIPPSLLRRPASRMHLGDLVEQIRREEAVESSREYALLGVRWYGEGLFIRERKAGSEVAAAKLYRVEDGDFVYNRLFAWKGSFAVAGRDVHNCYVSGEFPVFRVDTSSLDTRYLLAVFSDPAAWSTVENKSVGGTPTSRNRLKEQAFLALDIPVPSLEEQRAVAGLATELRKVREGAHRRRVYIQALQHAALNRAFAGLM
jgi:type I restriction enzyme S subunit